MKAPVLPLTREGMGIEDGLPLEASGGGVDELRRDIQRLMDIEACKRLKATYFRCLDTANFDELATLLHPEVSVHFIGGTYEWKLDGADEYVASIRQSFHKQSIGHHNGHTPEIRIVSDDEATGVWYLTDHMWLLNAEFYTTGTAIYWDRYKKIDGRWLIWKTRYQRIYELNEKIETPPPFSMHYLGTYGSEV